jgi:hypothetical protein
VNSNVLGVTVDSPEFEQQLLEALAGFQPSLTMANGAYRVSATRQSKDAVVVWPYPRAEVFIDFLEHSIVLLTESIEYDDAKPPAEQVQDLARVLRNFFLHETRVVGVGTLLKRQELQFRRGNKWVSVFGGTSET